MLHTCLNNVNAALSENTGSGTRPELSSRHQLKMVVVIFTGHAPVRGHLFIMRLFDGDPTCRFCRMETETVQHIVCCCKALARQRYNVFGKLTVDPKDISTASVRDLCLFIRATGLLNLC